MKKHRLKVLLMTLILVVGLLPVNVFADEDIESTYEIPLLPGGKTGDLEVNTNPSGNYGGTITLSDNFHTVRYNLRGGTTTSSFTSVEVPDGKKIEEVSNYQPNDPTKDDAVFDGWFTDETFETAFDFYRELTQDETAYARYRYRVIYDMMGGSLPDWSNGYFYQPENSTVTIPSQEDIEGWGMPPANTKWNGAYIDGVHYNPGDVYTFTDKPITVTASWVSTLPTTPTPTPTPTPNKNQSSSGGTGSNTGTGTNSGTSTNSTTTAVTAAETGDWNMAALCALLMLASLLSLALLIHSRRRVRAGGNR